MKRMPIVLICIAVLTSLCACSGNEQENAVHVDNESTADVSMITEKSESERSDAVSYPSETDELDNESLRYKSKDGRLNIVFPKMFCKKAEEQSSENSIYLSTSDGKATLSLEYIKNEGITFEGLKEHLEEKYKPSKAEDRSDSFLYFKTKTKDKKNNTVISYLKAVVKNDGYIEAILSYHEGDSSKYEPVMDQIEIN